MGWGSISVNKAKFKEIRFRQNSDQKRLNLGLIRYRDVDHDYQPVSDIVIYLKSEIQISLNATLINIGSEYATFRQYPNINISFPVVYLSRIEVNGKIIYRLDNSLTTVEKHLLLYNRMIMQGAIKHELR